MSLSKLFGALTRREPAAAEGTPAPQRASKPASSPDVGALLHGSRLQLVPAKEKEHSLGSQREVRERIAEVLPGVVFNEEGLGSFTRTGYSITFDTGHGEYVRTVSVEVTGGSAAMPPLVRLVSKTGWRLIPATT